jgi:hypothetical protein
MGLAKHHHVYPGISKYMRLVMRWLLNEQNEWSSTFHIQHRLTGYLHADGSGPPTDTMSDRSYNMQRAADNPFNPSASADLLINSLRAVFPEREPVSLTYLSSVCFAGHESHDPDAYAASKHSTADIHWYKPLIIKSS